MRLTSKQRIALAELDTKAKAFQNECSKKIQAIEKAFAVETNVVKSRMSDLVRPVRLQHEKDLKAMARQFEQDRRNLEKKQRDLREDKQFVKAAALLDIENAYNVALKEAEDVRDVAIEKVDTILQTFTKENHEKRKEITSE